MWKPVRLWPKLEFCRLVAQPFSNSAQILSLMGCVLVLLTDLLISATLFACIIGYKTDVIFRQDENRTLNQVCSLYSAAGGVRCVLSILVKEGKSWKRDWRFALPPPLLSWSNYNGPLPCSIPWVSWSPMNNRRATPRASKRKEVSAVALYFTQSFPVSVILESAAYKASCWRILPRPRLNSSQQMRPHHFWYTVVLWRQKHLLVD